MERAMAVDEVASASEPPRGRDTRFRTSSAGDVGDVGVENGGTSAGGFGLRKRGMAIVDDEINPITSLTLWAINRQRDHGAWDCAGV